MVTKGIIKSIDLLGNTCTVHIPFFETAGNDPIIETATVSNTPGSYNGYKVGDAVYVAFEDGNMSTPVVIGKLYLGTEKEKADPRGVSNVEESTATKKATLPADSKLTAEIGSTVANTTVPYSSLSSIANGLNKLNTDVGQMDRDYGNRFKQVISNAEGLKSEIEQTAENVVAKVSGYETDIAGNPILTEPTEFGWNLQADSWSVFNEDKTILTADKDGLHVAGIIDAESGHIADFLIKDNGIVSYTTSTDEDGKETEIPWITNFTNDGQELLSSPGVYVGTDGIRLGENFSVDTEGNLTTKNLTIAKDATIQGKIHSTNIDVAGLNADGVRVVKKNANGNKVDVNGNEIILPEDATDEEKTEAKAKEIVVFNADATKGTVEMSGFTVEDKKLHYYNPDYEYTYGGTSYKGTGVGIGAVPNGGSWAFWAGQQAGDGTTEDWGHNAPFKVGHDGSLFATRGEIGGFEIDTTKLSIKDKTFGAEDSLFLSNTNLTGNLGSDYSENWRFSIGNNFGVKNDGTLYSRNGIFDGEISASTCYLEDVKTFNFTGADLNIGGMNLSSTITSDVTVLKTVKFEITASPLGVSWISGGRSSFNVTIKVYAQNSEGAWQPVKLAEQYTLPHRLQYVVYKYWGGSKNIASSANKTLRVYFGKVATFPAGASEITFSTTAYLSEQYQSTTALTWELVPEQSYFRNNSTSITVSNCKTIDAAYNVLACSGGFIPQETNKGTLGTLENRWGNIYGAMIDAAGEIKATGTVTTEGNFIAKDANGNELFSVKAGTVAATNVTAKNFKATGTIEFQSETYSEAKMYSPAIALTDDTASPNCSWATTVEIDTVGWKSVELPWEFYDPYGSAMKNKYVVAVLATLHFPMQVTVTSTDSKGNTSSSVVDVHPTDFSSYPIYTHWDGNNIYVYNPVNVEYYRNNYTGFDDCAKISVVVLGRF